MNNKKNRKRNMNKKGEFLNKIEINGLISSCDPMTNYIPHPLFGFELESPLVSGIDFYENFNNPYKGDVSTFRCVVLNDEDAYNIITPGKYIRIIGEIQSRNFDKFHPIEEPELQNAVDLYYNIFDEFPTSKQPTERFDQLIQWSKLFEMDLLSEIPIDSFYDENQNEIDNEGNIYHYKVDWNGEVKRITHETIYEILIHEYKVIEEDPMDYYNLVELKGRISSDVNFDVGENGAITTFNTHNYLDYFRGVEKRFAFLPIELFGDQALNAFSEFKKGDFITIEGSLFSRNEQKILRNKKISPSGKVKRKKAEFKERNHFIVPKLIDKQ